MLIILLQEDETDLANRRITGEIKFKLYKDYFLAGAKPLALLLCFIIFITAQVSTGFMKFLNDWARFYCSKISEIEKKGRGEVWACNNADQIAVFSKKRHLLCMWFGSIQPKTKGFLHVESQEIFWPDFMTFSVCRILHSSP